MARLSKKELELKSIENFQKWFDRIDKGIKMLAVIVFGISFVSYIATLTAGFVHLIGVISKYEHNEWGWISVIAISIGLIGTEFSAVYGVVYEELQTSRNSKATDETKKFYEKLGIGSFVEFSMYFMAIITGFANFLYSLYVIKEKQNVSGVKFAFVSLEDIIGQNKFDDMFQIDPVTLLAITAFSTIIPIIMIVQSKMQIQFLRFIMKTIASIKRAQSQVETKVIEEKEDRHNKTIEKQLIKAGIQQKPEIVIFPSDSEKENFAKENIEPNIEINPEEKTIESKRTEIKEKIQSSEKELIEHKEVVEQQDNEVKVEQPKEIKQNKNKKPSLVKKGRSRSKKKTVTSPNITNKVMTKDGPIKRVPFKDDLPETYLDETGLGENFDQLE